MTTYHFGSYPIGRYSTAHVAGQYGDGANTLCGSWPAYLRGDWTERPQLVSCNRCAARLAKLGASLDAFARAMEVL